MTENQTSQPQTLLLGVGNLLMADEGIGLRVLERLVITYRIPEEVLVLDGGTLGLDLLYYLEGITNLLLVDAVDAGKTPGEIVRMHGDQVPTFLSIKISPHQIGISDMLFAAKLKGIYPPNVILWGVQPEKIEVGLELSNTLQQKVDYLVQQIIIDLQAWGHPIYPKV